MSTSSRGPVPMPMPVSLAPGLARQANNIGTVHPALRRDHNAQTIAAAATGGTSSPRRPSVMRRPPPLQSSRSFRQIHQALHSGKATFSMSPRTPNLMSPGARLQHAASASSAVQQQLSPDGSATPKHHVAPTTGSIMQLASARRMMSGGHNMPAVSESGASSSSSDARGHSASSVAAQPLPIAMAIGSGNNIPLDTMLGRTPLASEALLLTRIRQRATDMGLRVRLKPSGGMFNTLRSMFASELENPEDEFEDTAEEAEHEEEADDQDD